MLYNDLKCSVKRDSLMDIFNFVNFNIINLKNSYLIK